MKVSVVVNYSSLDKKFISSLLSQCLKFTDDIIIVSYDRLFSNTEESMDYITELCSYHSDKVKLIKLKFTNDNHPRYFHNLSRWEGMKNTKNDYVLFLDADEIPEGNLFNHIFSNDLLANYDGVDFKCHWYFRSVKNQAIQKENAGLLLNKNVITKESMFTDMERRYFQHIMGNKYLSNTVYDNTILIHHYSWVRQKEEMLLKVNWGHKFDRDWISLINEEFSRPFNGTDFVHGYSYNTVDNIFDITE